MTKREVMQMALDALNNERNFREDNDCVSCGETEQAISVIEAELAKPEPKPVAWLTEPVKGIAHHSMERSLDFNEPISKPDWVKTPLYRNEDL